MTSTSEIDVYILLKLGIKLGIHIIQSFFLSFRGISPSTLYTASAPHSIASIVHSSHTKGATAGDGSERLDDETSIEPKANEEDSENEKREYESESDSDDRKDDKSGDEH